MTAHAARIQRAGSQGGAAARMVALRTLRHSGTALRSASDVVTARRLSALEQAASRPDGQSSGCVPAIEKWRKVPAVGPQDVGVPDALTQMQVGSIRHCGGPFWLSDATEGIVGGMSGSPIIYGGAAVGVVCVGGDDQSGPNPRLVSHLPGRGDSACQS